MLEITAACNCGVGTSVMCQKLIKDVVAGAGYKMSDFTIGCTEVSTVSAYKGIIVTHKNLVPSLPKVGKDTIVVGVSSLVSNKAGLAEALLPHLKEAEEKGLISKA